MGGIFSGRWQGHAKKTRTDHCRSFGIATLVGNSAPVAGHAGHLEWRDADGKAVASITFGFVTDRRVVLGYRWGEKEQPVELRLDLETLATPNGGTRYLTRCPLAVKGVPCRRRVAKLYMAPGSPYFGCRGCHKLTYRSRQTHDARVSRLLRSERFDELAAHPQGQSMRTLGLLLSALDEDRRRLDRLLKRIGPKPKPRRRKPQ